MKLFSFAVLVSLGIGASSATPIQGQSLEEKYTEILVRVRQIRNLVVSAMNEIVKRSIEDNAEIGNEIKIKVEERVSEAEVIFEYLQTEVIAERLTYEQAEVSIKELNLILDEIVREVLPLVRQLSEFVQAHIANVFDVTYWEVVRLNLRIFELLV